MELQEIIEDVEKHLSEKRFTHSLGVMERIEELAILYGVDVEVAKKVGIAHDIAKEMSKEESLQYVKENGLELDEVEENIPYLLHGKIGADIAKKRYGFNEQMQKAILYHTVGNPKMDLLAKILFAADKTEKNRAFEQYDLEKERQLANTDLEEALIFMMEENIKNNIQKNKLIHPDSIYARNYLMLQKAKTSK